MRAKDVAFIADVLANEARHAMPEEVAGLVAAVGALRVAIRERQADADVTALLAVEEALAGRLYAPDNAILRTENDALAATIRRVEALADSLVWRRPERSPCVPHCESCCGDEAHCAAMQPSVSVVGEDAIRRALEGDPDDHA